jgi:hypothetical protein
MNALDLKIAINKLLEGRIGLFNNGTSGIWIEPPIPPPHLGASGLHVVISRQPILRQSQVGLTQITRIQDWRVTLRQYDTTSEGLHAFDESIALVRRAFPLLREKLLQVEEDVYPQITFLIQATEFLNQLPQSVI